MKLRIYHLLLLSCIGAMLSSCKHTAEENQAALQKEDSLKAAVTPATSNANQSMAPPDADYTGDYVEKYPNGIIKVNGFFRFGARHGQWMYFYDNGLKWSECYYNKGKKEGETLSYYPSGKLHYKGWFKNDLRDSLWFYYDEAGKEMDKRAFRNDQETGLVN